MHTPLTLSSLVSFLQVQVDQLCREQVQDPSRSDHGGVVTSDDGRPSPSRTAALVVGGVYLACAAADPTLRSAVDVPLPQMELAIAALRNLQRPSGLFDSPNVNIDCAPHTAFIAQRLCTALELGRAIPRDTAPWCALLSGIVEILGAAVPGMATGGFHTPNHRWVVASALAQCAALVPDLDVKDAVGAYLAEGIDVDEEGFYIERSVGVYDAVNARGWLLLAESWDVPPGALDAVARNLDLDLHLLHWDGTAETGLSHRQDHGRRVVPAALIHCYLLFDRLRPTPRFRAAAHHLWRKAKVPGDIQWTWYALMKSGHLGEASARLPDDYVLHLPRNGIWRLRRDKLSVSAFQGGTRLLGFSYGTGMLSTVRIHQTYFGGACGHFVSDEMTYVDGVLTLRSEGCGLPRRPGYELPLGCEVPPEFWDARTPERTLRELPPAASKLELVEIRGGLELRYVTLGGMDRVATQIALDFEPGGIWETADTRLRPQPGQVLFLKTGWGEMRYGTDVIRVEGSAYGHSMWAMRESEPQGDSVRVLLTFNTPVDHTFRLIGLSKPDAV